MRDRIPYTRVSSVASLCNGIPFSATDFMSGGGIPLIRIRDLLGSAFDTFVSNDKVPSDAIVRNGDVLIGMDGDFNPVMWTRGTAALNQRVCLLRCHDRADQRFLYYSLIPAMRDINRKTLSTTVKHLSSADVLQRKIWWPRSSVRRHVVSILDVATAKIDHLIAKQRKLESLLDERELPMREALFGCYVGTGERLKWHLSETTTRLGSVDPGEQPLLSVSIHWGVRPRAETIGEASTADSFDHYKTVDVGDIIVNRMRAFQGALGSSTFTGFTSPDYAVFKPDGEIDPSWLMQVMKTQSFVGEMTNRLTGIGGTEGGKVRTPRINSDDLLNIRIHIPSQSRQRANVSEFQTQIQETAKLKKSTERMITLLHERRSALITAAVTGKIEV